MMNEQPTAKSGRGATIAGWVLGGLPCALLSFSAAMKFIQPDGMEKNMEQMGWPIKYAIALGVVELASTLIYLFPRTAMLGAILLTGYMGGAIATHARIGEPFVVQVLVGVLLWLGLFLREPRLRVLTPWRR